MQIITLVIENSAIIGINCNNKSKFLHNHKNQIVALIYFLYFFIKMAWQLHSLSMFSL